MKTDFEEERTGVKILDAEDVYHLVYLRLAFGEWAILVGESEAVSLIEDMVYPPGTSDNADFELIFAPRKYFFLVKKTSKLRVVLKLEQDASSWNSLFAIRVVNMGGNNVLFDTRHFKRIEERETLLESFVKAIIDEMEASP
ncbi:MAG: hypothetical protein M1477_00800 [Candidatus Thermoplasmatota archaeon]|nr:hypothetical protein [Candidatus Thermoplasmatota archaeon]